MVFALDPELEPAVCAVAVAMAGVEPPAVGDVLGLRSLINANLLASFGQLPMDPAVEAASYEVMADGCAVPMLWYSKPRNANPAAVVYVHGGGMVCGSIAIYDRLVRHYVSLTGTNFLAVGYRLAPEYRDVGLARDVFAGLRWLRERAGSLGIDPSRIAVMGDSGGGGVAAAAAIMARDNSLSLARQILVYPMLNDLNTEPDPLLEPFALWSYDNNRTAWSAVLGAKSRDDAVSPYAAPARLDDFQGLPPAYIEVGELDIFRDESIGYAKRLLDAGVSCELHVHPGAPHGFEWIDCKTGLSSRALSERVRVITTL